MNSERRITHVLSDLDNTLYNWVDYYVPSFLSMVKELARITSLDEEDLKRSFKRVHERHRTTEYSFAIEELDILAPMNVGLSVRQVLARYESAIKAFRTTRKQTLCLYPGVLSTLRALHERGVRIVAVTESLHFHAIYRLKQLGIEEYFAAIVCHPDHGLPLGATHDDLRFHKEIDRYESAIPITIRPLENVRKPDVRFLEPLFAHLSIKPDETIYVGDSMTKDVLMAQSCGAWDVYAIYGREVDPYNYSELLKITYWTEDDLAFERALIGKAVRPSTTVSQFDQLLSLLDVRSGA